MLSIFRKWSPSNADGMESQMTFVSWSASSIFRYMVAYCYMSWLIGNTAIFLHSVFVANHTIEAICDMLSWVKTWTFFFYQPRLWKAKMAEIPKSKSSWRKICPCHPNAFFSRRRTIQGFHCRPPPGSTNCLALIHHWPGACMQISKWEWTQRAWSVYLLQGLVFETT